MNSWALYYNKSMLASSGAKRPPTTLAQLDADSAKEWVVKNGKLVQMGLYPDTDGNGFEFYSPFFGATNCLTPNGKYDYANCKAAQTEMKWIASFDKYPYSQVMSLEASLGEVAGGDDDAFVAGKAGFELSGPWIGATNIPFTNKGMEKNFGVVPFPGPVAGTTLGQGNYNIIPKGAREPQAAFEFISWLAGFQNPWIATLMPKGGWIPASPQVVKAPAYRAWLKESPWLAAFLPPMSNKRSETPVLTTNEDELETAEANATNYVLEKTMSPEKALEYIDSQGNARA